MLGEFDGTSFGKALASAEGLQLPVIVRGLVKKTADTKIIDFSPDTIGCDYWLNIPLTMIEKVAVLGKRQCLDHVHDYVAIQFKAPTDSEAKVFASLLGLLGSQGAFDASAIGKAWVDCVIVRIFSFVSGNIIHSERVTQPNLAQKVQNILKSWAAEPYGQNWSSVSNC